MAPLEKIRSLIDGRFNLNELLAPFKKKTVPRHRLTYWYFLGGITLFLFVIQVLTGILLLLYYRPGANEAFESVQYIMTQVQFGWLIRSIHSWSANLMIFTAFAHMFSVLFLIKPQGIGVQPKIQAEWLAKPTSQREMKFFPNFMLRELMAWYVALGVLGALAAILPWDLGVKADPFVPTPAGIKPEWYFLFMFQTLKLIPSKVAGIDGEILGILSFGLVAFLWLLIPFFEREHPARTRQWIAGVALFALAYIAGMTIYGHFAQ